MKVSLAMSLRLTRCARLQSALPASRSACGLKAPLPKLQLSPVVRSHCISTARVIQRPRVPKHGISQKSSLSTMSTLESILTPALLSSIRDLWFGHIDGEDALVVPDQEHMKPWFFGGQEFDNLCVDGFASTLEAIKASGVTTGQQIVDAAKPKGPLDWLSLMILLDQMPRNCYRGADASVAFKVFDPMAREVSTMALEKGMDTDPKVRWFMCRRMWFYLPMMHSEDIATHEKATKAYERMASDVEALASGKQEGDDPVRARAVQAMSGCADRAREMVKSQVLFEKKHYDIIKQFGRYPHRNEAMGRESTQEEIDYLAAGGETFSAPPKQG